MILSIAFLFVAAFLAGVWGLVWFNLHVLDLGDPKFRTAVGFYFIFSVAFRLPAVITAIVFLSRARQDQEWRLLRLAGIYLALIFAAVELSWLFELEETLVLLVEYPTLGFLFWKIRKFTDMIRHA